MRQLRLSKLDLHMAAVRDLLGIFECFQRIRKQLLHLLFGFHIILSALIAHTILVRQLLSGLDTEQDVMRLGIVRIGVVQKEVSFSKAVFIFFRYFFCFVIHAAHQITLYLAGKAGTERNDALMVGS